MDLRRNYNNGLDELADALKDHLGITAVNKQIQQKKQTITREDLKKLALPAGLILLRLSCVSGFTLECGREQLATDLTGRYERARRKPLTGWQVDCIHCLH